MILFFSDDVKGRQEQEAARSLLTLAQTPHPSPGNDRSKEREAREAGLVAPKGSCGVSTYPYRLSSEHPRRITPSIPGTPTLSAISEHKEREKVSENIYHCESKLNTFSNCSIFCSEL